MAGNDRDAAQAQPDPIGPPGHSGGTYGERDISQAARRSQVRDQVGGADDAAVEEASPLRDDVNAKAATDL